MISDPILTIDRNEKDGGCIFHQNALRSEVVSKIKLTSAKRQLDKRVHYFLVFLMFYVLRCIFWPFFTVIFCLMPAMHAGKTYMLPSFLLWSKSI